MYVFINNLADSFPQTNGKIKYSDFIILALLFTLILQISNALGRSVKITRLQDKLQTNETKAVPQPKFKLINEN